MSATGGQVINRGGARMVPVLIVALFVLPMIGAWVAFTYFPDQMRRLGTTNFGRFIQPPQALSLQGFEPLQGSIAGDDVFAGKWTYLHIESSECDERCRANLYETRQVRLTQGKEVHRLQRVLVLSDGEHLRELLPFLRAQHPQLLVLRGHPDGLARLSAALRVGEGDPLHAQRSYVVDPLGQAMMYYEPSGSPEAVLVTGDGMRKDMAKLLHNSKTR